MTRFIVPSACGLVAAVVLVAMPAEAKAQYARPGVGISVATPGFGINLGFGQPTYRPAPYVAPYSVYSPGYGGYPRPFAAPQPIPHWTPYRGWHTHSPYGPYQPNGNHGHPHGPRY